MDMIDQVALNFDPTSLTILNVILALVIFGIALDLKASDFLALRERPRAIVIGFLAQFLFLPAATWLLVLILEPRPSIALGMMLVAACPGGNMSNFVAHRANGNTALSISLSAVCTVASVVLTPFNLAFWASLYEPTARLMHETSVNVWDMAGAVLILLLLPISIGMLVNAYLPRLAARLRTPLKYGSLGVFAFFILAALAANWTFFIHYVGAIAGLVLLQNAIGFFGGYAMGWLGRVPEGDRRAIAIEAGMQNTGLGLVLIFSFFGGLGGMAIIAAWWGVWHLVGGLALAETFRAIDRRARSTSALSA